MDYIPLSKKARPVLFVTAAVQALAFAGVCSVALWAIPLYGAGNINLIRILVTAVVVLLALAWTILAPTVRFRRYRYRIADDRIEIVEGIVYIRRTVVPIDRIHQIDIVRGPLDSRFGLAKVTVTTAGATATMRFLELDKAESICETLNSTVTQKLRNKMGDQDV